MFSSDFAVFCVCLSCIFIMSMSDDDLGLLAASYTALLGFKVVKPGQSNDSSLAGTLQRVSLESLGGGDGRRPKISVHEMFHTVQHAIFPIVPRLPQQQSSQVVLEGAHDYSDVYDVNVKMINGETTTIQVGKNHSANDIKEILEEKLGIPFANKMLTVKGKPFYGHQTVAMFAPTPPHAKPQGYVNPMIYCVGGEDCPYELDCSDLDPSFNYDFTNEKDDGQEYIRGGHVYKRPYGWKRFAVKVLNRYDNNIWLGGDGIRTASTTGEWPVSYHGTNHDVINKIIEEGYKIGPKDKYGPGVYSSPSLAFCEKEYSVEFEYKGDMWKVALQNRVNPAKGHLYIIPPDENWGKVEFWRSPLQDPDEKIYDVRPYGVLFKKVS